MTRTFVVLSLAACLAAPAAEAGPRVSAKPEPGAAIRARASVLNGFDGRMSRLDALMGAAPRARSAAAGR